MILHVPNMCLAYFEVGFKSFQIVSVGLLGGLVKQLDLFIGFHHVHKVFIAFIL